MLQKEYEAREKEWENKSTCATDQSERKKQRKEKIERENESNSTYLGQHSKRERDK